MCYVSPVIFFILFGVISFKDESLSFVTTYSLCLLSMIQVLYDESIIIIFNCMIVITSIMRIILPLKIHLQLNIAVGMVLWHFK